MSAGAPRIRKMEHSLGDDSGECLRDWGGTIRWGWKRQWSEGPLRWETREIVTLHEKILVRDRVMHIKSTKDNREYTC